MSQDFNVDAFFDGVANSLPATTGNPEDRGPYVNKLSLNYKPYHGNATIVPFPTADGSFYAFFNKTELVDNRIRELDVYHPEKDADLWHRILPIEYYPNLSPEDSALYKECVSLFDSVDEAGYLATEYPEPAEMRRRAYGLITGFLIGHYDLKQESLIGKEGGTKAGPTLIVIPSAKVVTAMKANMDATTVNNGNDKSWISLVYNKERTNREGFVTIGCTAAAQGYGYDITFTHGNNSPMSKAVPADFVISEEEANLFDSIIKLFLGWQYGTDGAFNRPSFERIKARLLEVIQQKTSVAQAAVQGGGEAPVAQIASDAVHAPAMTAAPVGDPMLNTSPAATTFTPAPDASAPIPPAPEHINPLPGVAPVAPGTIPGQQ